MALTLDSGFGGHNFLKGVWVNEIEVKDMRDAENNKDFNGNPYDFALELVVNKNGHDRKIWFRGNLSKNKPDSWGGAFKIRDLLVTMSLFDGLNKDEKEEKLNILSVGNIPADFYLRAKGKKLLILEYVNDLYQGKPTYRTWDSVRKLDYDRNKFVEEFKKELERKKKDGYPLPYKPELLEMVEKVSSVTVSNDDFPI